MQKKSILTLRNLMIPCLIALFTCMYSGAVFGQKDENIGLAPVLSGIIEGKIMEVETNTLVVETENGKTVRVRMPGNSGKSASEFAEGEFIEAAVSPEGITTSVKSGPQIQHK